MIYTITNHRRGLSKRFSPYDLGRDILRNWWSADDHGTARMTDDGAGLISSWTDRIAGLAVTAVTAARPTYGATALAGRPALTFDGVANCLASTSLTNMPTGAQDGEIWALFSQDAAAPADTGNRDLIRYGGTSADTFRMVERTYNNPNSRLRIGTTTTSTLRDASIIFEGVHFVRAQFFGTTLATEIDGVDTSPATLTGGALNTGTTRIRIGATNGTTAVNFWKGPIRDLLVMRGQVPDAVAAELAAWFARGIA